MVTLLGRQEISGGTGRSWTWKVTLRKVALQKQPGLFGRGLETRCRWEFLKLSGPLAQMTGRSACGGVRRAG